MKYIAVCRKYDVIKPLNNDIVEYSLVCFHWYKYCINPPKMWELWLK